MEIQEELYKLRKERNELRQLMIEMIKKLGERRRGDMNEGKENLQALKV